MFKLSRDNPILYWWYKIDKSIFLTILILMCIGFLAIMSVSQYNAIRLEIGNSYHFVHKQMIFILCGMFIMISLSLFNIQMIQILGIAMIVLSILMMVYSLIFLDESQLINGSKRWINIFGQNLQPSEFLKIGFAIVNAMILRSQMKFSLLMSLSLYFLCVLLLMLQPDFGMIAIVSVIFGGQLFISGIKIVYLYCFVGFLICIGMVGYFFYPHFAERVNIYLGIDGDNYQISKSLESFQRGGLFGVGAGNGKLKEKLPDAHTDFVFAMIGEEFGAIICILIMMLYLFVFWRVCLNLFAQNNSFHILVVFGLVSMLMFQILLNIGSCLSILPTKGVTLPFISYGGSSMFSCAILIGIVLSICKKQYGKVNHIILFK